MYTQYWNLKTLPFENAPDPRFFFESKNHREAAVRLMFAIETRKAMALITGDYGSGKTVLCQTVMSRLPAGEYKVAHVCNPRLDALDLTREIGYQLGEEIPAGTKYEVLHRFNNLLDRHNAGGRHCAALIDEAQLIGDPAVLEDIRLLLNHQVGGQFLLTVVLIGQTELREMLRPIPQLVQRIELKFHVSRLDELEVRDYMAHRLTASGGELAIFDEGAVAEIAKLSKGLPREINAICDMCLLTVSLIGRKRITVEDVIDAANERA